MDIATYVEGEEGADSDYAKIYGSNEKEGSKNFYFELTAYDSAIRYPVDGSAPTADDQKGNKTNKYYLYEDISTIFADYSIKITDVYHMFNGTYTPSSKSTTESDREQVVEDVMRYLRNEEIGKGIFSLNPENSPTLSVTGRSQLEKVEVTRDGENVKVDRKSVV